jgi:hypothetical protein
MLKVVMKILHLRHLSAKRKEQNRSHYGLPPRWGPPVPPFPPQLEQKTACADCVYTTDVGSEWSQHRRTLCDVFIFKPAMPSVRNSIVTVGERAITTTFPRIMHPAVWQFG